ncbi:MAG TPA: hypothetical protein VMM38_09430, partial [Aridibacter sp.]|nr:hypothetical protein [Aridibacter sp.]
VDLISPKFISQKMGYIHMNPVRAGLRQQPENWKWSSCRALHPANQDPVPLTVDFRCHWRQEEILSGREK